MRQEGDRDLILPELSVLFRWMERRWRIFGVFYTLSPVSLDTFAELRRANISFVMCVRPSVHMEQLDCHWTDIYVILYLSTFRKCIGENSNFLKIGRMTGTLREDQYTFVIISRRILLRMRNVSDKRCRENQNTHLTCNPRL
jgi:hypothetical protein